MGGTAVGLCPIEGDLPSPAAETIAAIDQIDGRGRTQESSNARMVSARILS